MGITHFDDALRRELEIGHLRATWTFLGEAAGSVGVGLRRLQIPADGWSTPVHQHGREEEIFYVLAGRGHSLHGSAVADVRAGDCIVYLPRSGAHTLHAVEPLDVLAFGTREYDEAPWFPRLDMALLGTHGVEARPRRTPYPIQFEREAELGPPELEHQSVPDRPASVVNVADVEAVTIERPRIARTRRRVSAAAGSRETGLQHVEVAAGKYSTAQHCHSAEEELFVILEGGGVLLLDQEETAVRPGHVVARPAATGVAHVFRAGPDGLTYLAYGTRKPEDLCYYPRSGKIAFRGVGVMGRIEQTEDYWEGED